MKVLVLLTFSIFLVGCVSIKETGENINNTNNINNIHVNNINNNTNNFNNTNNTSNINNSNNTNNTSNTNNTNNTNNINSCVSATGEAINVTLPVDIIWAVDSSNSMGWESDTVESGINGFAGFIAQTGLDYHVIMVADNSICVPPPLAGPSCTDATSYRHLNVTVDSNNALEVIVNNYPQFQDFLRPNSKVSFVIVSDDDSLRDAQWFTGHVQSFTDPGIADGWVFHSIVAQGGYPIIGCCSMNGCGAAIGTNYLELSTQTGGIDASICEEDWTPIFSAIAANIAIGTTLPCTYTIPDPGELQVVNLDEVNVEFIPSDDATPSYIPHIATALYCEPDGGWYYDDPADPTAVILCPNTCETTQEGELRIIFGCDTIVQ